LSHADSIARDSARDGLIRALGLSTRGPVERLASSWRPRATNATSEPACAGNPPTQLQPPHGLAPARTHRPSCARADNRVKDDRMNELSVARNATSAQTRNRCENR
jgi:hypothetical protein